MSYPAPLYLGLVHHPIFNKIGEVVTTAITTFDIHDSARVGRTFDVKTTFLISPIVEQQGLVTYFKEYWTTGAGGARHASRKEALLRIDGALSLEEALREIETREGVAPLVVATSARTIPATPTWTMGTLMSQWKSKTQPLFLLFGTGWGLADAAFKHCHAVLPPISGPDTYNHLPVRAAIAIYLHEIYQASR